MQMRRFLRSLGGFFALQGLLAAPLAFRIAHQPPPRTYLAADIAKHRRLSSLHSPRIVFLGGSGTAFGVDSPRVEAALRKPVVNMGLYLPLGMDFMLNEVDDELRSGDVVIVSMEYALLFSDANPDALRQLVEVYPRSLRWIPPAQARSLLDSIYKPLGRLARQAIRGWVSTPEPEVPEYPPYSLDSFNEYGDIVAHHRLASRPKSYDSYGLGSPQADPFRRHVERLNRFYRSCVSRGIHVWYSYPAVAREALESQGPAFLQTVGELERGLDIPKLHRADLMIFPATMFFDSWEHLNLEGKTRRTDLIIENLETQLRR